jgi:hypothetical protein
MQTETFIQVLKNTAALLKLATDPASAPSFDVPPYTQFAVAIQRHVRLAWYRKNWRDLIALEQRTLDANGFLAYEQPGFRRIGKLPPESTIYGIWLANPDQTDNRVIPCHWNPTDGGIQVRNQPANQVVWVRYQVGVPRFTTTYYVPGANQYNSGDVVFWPPGADEQVFGDCYEARFDASYNFYWEKQIIPLCIADYVTQAAFAEALRADGQFERATQEMDVAADLLAHAGAYWTEAQGINSMARVRA